MQRLTGTVQHYDWGSTTALPRLLGHTADGTPWAEWWLGTHPSAPSRLADGTPLSALAGELPFLVKVLAAAQPLSLQTHPDAATAAAGFAQEEAAGVPINARHRVYRDPFAKPELLCALEPFDVLCGFREVPHTLTLLERLGCTDLAAMLSGHGLEATVRSLYQGAAPEPVQQALDACTTHVNTTPKAAAPEAVLVHQLAARFPDDASVVVTLLLNRLVLAPGEAVYLGPGNLHAYLAGTGVEIMGASDNVVRGGLTTKHVAVDELLNVLRYEPLADPVVRPVVDAPWRRYPTPSSTFSLDRLDLDGDVELRATSPQIVLCTAGDAGVASAGEAIYLAPSETVTLSGRAQVFVAA